MSAPLIPIHTATVGKSTLRFFKSPSAAPEFPWHSNEDLMLCLGLPRTLRRALQRVTANGVSKGMQRTVATADGLVTIASHAGAQGLISAAIEVGAARPEFEMAYVKAIMAAFEVLQGDRPPIARYEFVIAAAKTHLGGGQ